MYSLALTINTHGPLGASTYTVMRARLRLNTRGQPGIPTRSFSLCAFLAPRQIHDASRPSHVLPMAIHRSVHEAKGAGCGRLPGTVVALGSSGSSACSPVWAVLSPLSRSRPRSTSLKTPSRLGRQAPGRVELDSYYSTHRSRPSPGCAQARQALPPVGGARQGSLGPAYPGAARTAAPRPSPLPDTAGSASAREPKMIQ